GLLHQLYIPPPPTPCIGLLPFLEAPPHPSGHLMLPGGPRSLAPLPASTRISLVSFKLNTGEMEEMVPWRATMVVAVGPI
uniref:Uncharacterized protein n=1 Tax=Triticum urartu TaxID=4572 RepID=A0A8R7QKI8_TRIUA